MEANVIFHREGTDIYLPCNLNPDKEKKYPRILCSIPVYNSVTPEPFIHFLILAQESGLAEAQGRWAIRWYVAGPKIRTIPARESSAQVMMQSGASHLLFIDDDMLILNGMVDKLLSFDVDIVAPLFFGGNGRPLICDVDEYGNPTPMWEYPKDSFFEAPGGVGTGVMLIKRKVLEAMDPPYFRPSLDPKIGEDIGFCLRAGDLGFQSWCDSSMIIDQMDVPKVLPRGN